MPSAQSSAAVFCALLGLGCASHRGVAAAEGSSAGAEEQRCEMRSATPWIERWLGAWEVASEQILELPDAPAPEIVFFDSACVYSTSAVATGGAPAVDGPGLRGAKLRWRAVSHDGSITLPGRGEAPVQLMSFADFDEATGAFFVMAAPSFWAKMGDFGEPGLTAVFLHEFAHTRQMEGVSALLERIECTWPYPEELNDDAVQTHFQDDPEYVEAYLAERDLLYRAAEAESDDEARVLAGEALLMMRTRRARWFIEEREVFAELDDLFLVLEGVGQWTAFAWLSDPAGGRLARETAIRTMLGKRGWWTQDEGLVLLLVVDRLLPQWPELVFRVPSIGAIELLARAAAP